MISCSDFQEQEQILDYSEYIYQGWNAFETVNLNESTQDMELSVVVLKGVKPF